MNEQVNVWKQSIHHGPERVFSKKGCAPRGLVGADELCLLQTKGYPLSGHCRAVTPGRCTGKV
jgi:hypothetical protein